MRKMIIPLIFLFSFVSVFAITSKTCTDSNTLEIITEKIITTDGTDENITTVESANCPDGCANGECKPTKVNMTVTIYIFFATLGVLLMLISFLKSDILIFKWLAVAILFMLGATSFNINKEFCEHTSSGWSCYVQQYNMVNLAYFWFGIGSLMFIYAFWSSVVQPAREVVNETNRSNL